MPELVLGHQPVLNTERQYVNPGVRLIAKGLSVPVVGTAAVPIQGLAHRRKVDVYGLTGLVTIGDGELAELAKDRFKQGLAQRPSGSDHRVRVFGVVAETSGSRGRAEQEVPENEILAKPRSGQLVELPGQPGLPISGCQSMRNRPGIGLFFVVVESTGFHFLLSRNPSSLSSILSI